MQAEWVVMMRNGRAVTRKVPRASPVDGWEFLVDSGSLTMVYGNIRGLHKADGTACVDV